MNKVRVDHIGIIVEDLDASIAMFTQMFGEGPAMRRDMPEVGLKIAEFETANIGIELLQFSGENDAVARKVMGEKTGVNHFSLKVANIAGAIAEMKAAGIETMDGFPRDGAHGRVAFFKPETTGNILLEVCGPE